MTAHDASALLKFVCIMIVVIGALTLIADWLKDSQ